MIDVLDVAVGADPRFIAEPTTGTVALPDSPGRPPEEGASSQLADAVCERTLRTVARFQDSPRGWTNHGLACLAAGRLDEAWAALGHALELDPEQLLASVGQLRILTARSNFEAARQAADGLLTEQGSTPVLLAACAELAERMEDNARAAALWQRLTQVRADAPLPHFHLALALRATGELRGAVRELKAALRLVPQAAVFYHALGVLYSELGAEGQALQAFRAALALQPDSPAALHGVIGILIRRQELDQAQAQLEERLRVDRADALVHELLAEVSFHRRAFSQARTRLLEGLGLGRDLTPGVRSRMHNNLGVCYWHLGDRITAGRMFTRAIEDGSDTSLPYQNLARCEIYAGRLAEARAVLDECRNRFPHSEDSRLVFAQLLYGNGHRDLAIEDLDRLVHAPDAPARAFACLGVFLEEGAQRHADAMDVLLRGLELFPANPLLINNLAYVYLMGGEVHAARGMLESLPSHGVADAETSVVLPATWGLLHLWEGNLRAGVQGYRRAQHRARETNYWEWVSIIEQKMRLELARTHLRGGDRHSAQIEVTRGLATSAEGAYRNDLVALEKVLK